MKEVDFLNSIGIYVLNNVSPIVPLTLIALMCVYFVIYIVVTIVKNERNKKKYTPTMKIGDSVYYPIASGGVNGEVYDIDGDTVKVILTVNKSSLYNNLDFNKK